MARKLRIELAGGVFHVHSRGDRREAIFGDVSDRYSWLTLLSDVCQRNNWICHAWCLMDNHYHLVLETPEKTLSKGMHRLNGIYTQFFNHRHGLVGHLYQGRFKSTLVEKDSYMLELIRYVLLNPVRAKLAEAAGHWPWSSYRTIVGHSESVSSVGSDIVLGEFHRDRSRARELFIKFIQDGVGQPSIWENLREGAVIGSEQFVLEVIHRYGEKTVPIKTRRLLKRRAARSLKEFDRESKSSRNESMAEAYSSGGYTMEEIAKHFGVNRSTVCRAIRALRK